MVASKYRGLSGVRIFRKRSMCDHGSTSYGSNEGGQTMVVQDRRCRAGLHQTIKKGILFLS